MRLTVDADADSGDRDPHPGAGPLQRRLDVGNQAVKLDGALQQPPDANNPDEGQHRRDTTEPHQQAMRVMRDMLRRGALRVRPRLAARPPRYRLGSGLTRTGWRASVAAVAGIAADAGNV